MKEKIRYNPFNEGINTNLVAMKGEVKRRRIFPVNRLFDVLFDSHIWVLCKTIEGLENPTDQEIRMKYYLLCLIAATTGLRAGEVFMLKKSGMEKLGGIWFLNIENSRADLADQGLKTENAYRRVPLHKFVYQAINDYIDFANITSDYLFYTGNGKNRDGRVFVKAYKECGIHCGYIETEIDNSNVDYHSFRHFYRTILSQGGLSKELITYFMGHAKNMNDMGERYTNYEEIGNDIGDIGLLVDNGRKVINVIDTHINNAYTRHNQENEKQIVFIEPKEIALTNYHKSRITYWTYAVVGYVNFENCDDDV